MRLTTTLALLRKHDACTRGYNLIADHVGRDFMGQIDLLTILDVNGQDDCLWALRATEQPEGLQVAVAFAIYCAEPFCADEAWRMWAANWMNGSGRSEAAALAAAAASEAAAAAALAAATAAATAAAEAATAAWAAWAAAARAAKAAARAGVDDKPRQLTILRHLLRDE